VRPKRIKSDCIIIILLLAKKLINTMKVEALVVTDKRFGIDLPYTNK